LREPKEKITPPQGGVLGSDDPRKKPRERNVDGFERPKTLEGRNPKTKRRFGYDMINRKKLSKSIVFRN